MSNPGALVFLLEDQGALSSFLGGYRGGVPDRELTDALIEVVKERMEGEGMSLGRLADAAGTSRQTLTNQLRGIGVPTLDTLDAVAAALHTDLEELLAAARRRV
ncbi:helix-turn-helix domain-containing protein [Enterococcus hirae]|uniref:helix-turn-helix domain-containing protein n=1 Tax=Enterococcus hirae TaxID=1354 RepID=UPI00136CE184|nr:helix-turn-helix transcriptional regulator [Enterococcus hirae]NAE18091.1 helix-turn-helix domain-containing protein [Enterococcus hirae]